MQSSSKLLNANSAVTYNGGRQSYGGRDDSGYMKNTVDSLNARATRDSSYSGGLGRFTKPANDQI